MDIYEKMFKEFQISAHRIESLPVYHIEGGEWEEFEKYTKGMPIESFANQDWVEQVKAWKNSGKEIKRIHVLPPNLTEYLLYELEWCYPRNWIAGEEIKLVSQKMHEQFVRPETKGDFWIFDKRNVLKMEYDQEGHYLGEKVINEPHFVAQFVDLFTKLDQKSVPYPEIMKQLRKQLVSISRFLLP